jgi:Protein of unknown function (DUF1214)
MQNYQLGTEARHLRRSPANGSCHRWDISAPDVISPTIQRASIARLWQANARIASANLNRLILIALFLAATAPVMAPARALRAEIHTDGSLTLYFRSTSPGIGKEANWVPSPNDDVSLYIRAYSPKAVIMYGTWKPPAVILQN